MDVVHPKRGCEAGVVKPTNPEPEPRMKVHKNAHMTVHGRYLLVTRVRERGWRIADAALAAGVSERTAYKWLARWRAGGANGLQPVTACPAETRVIWTILSSRVLEATSPPLRVVGSVAGVKKLLRGHLSAGKGRVQEVPAGGSSLRIADADAPLSIHDPALLASQIEDGAEAEHRTRETQMKTARSSPRILQSTSTAIGVIRNPLKRRRRGFVDRTSPSASLPGRDILFPAAGVGRNGPEFGRSRLIVRTTGVRRHAHFGPVSSLPATFL
jgi:hypothetical protein